MKKFIASLTLFILSFMFISMSLAQSVTSTTVVPAASPVAPVVVSVVSSPSAQTGVLAWIDSHGGFQAAVLMLVTGFFGILSAVRLLLYKLDGIKQGDPIPADYKGLTIVNKICLVLGSVVDFFTGNMAH